MKTLPNNLQKYWLYYKESFSWNYMKRYWPVYLYWINQVSLLYFGLIIYMIFLDPANDGSQIYITYIIIFFYATGYVGILLFCLIFLYILYTFIKKQHTRSAMFSLYLIVIYCAADNVRMYMHLTLADLNGVFMGCDPDCGNSLFYDTWLYIQGHTYPLSENIKRFFY